jgi:acyl-CoA thioesterase
VDKSVLNSHGVAQGGAVFTLADFAFGAAAMTRGRVVLTVDMTISYLRATPAGRTLTAVAEEIKAGRHLCNYRVTVANDAGETVAIFQGTGYRMDDRVPGLEDAERRDERRS